MRIPLRENKRRRFACWVFRDPFVARGSLVRGAAPANRSRRSKGKRAICCGCRASRAPHLSGGSAQSLSAIDACGHGASVDDRPYISSRHHDCQLCTDFGPNSRSPSDPKGAKLAKVDDCRRWEDGRGRLSPSHRQRCGYVRGGSWFASLALACGKDRWPLAPFLNDNVFGPQDIQAMSTALEDVCKILDLSDEAKSERELLAQNILALAHRANGAPRLFATAC